MLSDIQIKELVRTQNMIYPFVDHQKKDTISYGLSSYGYDIRVAEEFKIFKPTLGTVVDPLQFKDSLMETAPVLGGAVIIPPNSFALARTVERFHIPRDIMTICVGKSTYARCGLIVNVTPFEPEWEGYATLEISNTTPSPAKVYVNAGIAQLIFFRGDTVCGISYADRKGKYQSQPAEVVTAKC